MQKGRTVRYGTRGAQAEKLNKGRTIRYGTRGAQIFDELLLAAPNRPTANARLGWPSVACTPEGLVRARLRGVARFAAYACVRTRACTNVCSARRRAGARRVCLAVCLPCPCTAPVHRQQDHSITLPHLCASSRFCARRLLYPCFHHSSSTSTPGFSFQMFVCRPLSPDATPAPCSLLCPQSRARALSLSLKNPPTF